MENSEIIFYNVNGDIMIDYRIIGQRIYKQRRSLGITQEALAEKVGVSANYISKVERGKERPNLDMLGKICVVININLARLLIGVCEEEFDYLHSDFAELLKECSPEKRKLIYFLAEKISETDILTTEG